MSNLITQISREQAIEVPEAQVGDDPQLATLPIAARAAPSGNCGRADAKRPRLEADRAAFLVRRAADDRVPDG